MSKHYWGHIVALVVLVCLFIYISACSLADTITESASDSTSVQSSADESWVCSSCGTTNTTKFCGNCGAAKQSITYSNAFTLDKVTIYLPDDWECYDSDESGMLFSPKGTEHNPRIVMNTSHLSNELAGLLSPEYVYNTALSKVDGDILVNEDIIVDNKLACYVEFKNDGTIYQSLIYYNNGMMFTCVTSGMDSEELKNIFRGIKISD